MLIRSQNGARIMETDSIVLDHYEPTGKYSLLAADELDPEGVVVAVYDKKEHAEVAMKYAWDKVAGENPVDLTTTIGDMLSWLRR